MFLAFFLGSLLLQLCCVYAAARWDYRSSTRKLPWGLGPQHLQWLLSLLGTLYLGKLLIEGELFLLCGALLPAGGRLAWQSPVVIAVLLTMLLLAWPRFRQRILRLLGFDPHQLRYGMLLYYLLSLFLAALWHYLPPVATAVPLLATELLTAKVIVFAADLGMLAIALLGAGLGSRAPASWLPTKHRLGWQQGISLRIFGIACLGLVATQLSDACFRMAGGTGTASAASAGLITAREMLALGDAESLALTIATGLLVALGTGIAEEFLFRGLLQPRLGIPTTSLLFTLTMEHLERPFVDLLALFSGSLLWGWLAQRYGLWAAVLVHSMNNALARLLPLLPDLLRQGLMFLLCLLGLLVVLWFSLRAGYRWYRTAQSRDDDDDRYLRPPEALREGSRGEEKSRPSRPKNNN